MGRADTVGAWGGDGEGRYCWGVGVNGKNRQLQSLRRVLVVVLGC